MSTQINNVTKISIAPSVNNNTDDSENTTKPLKELPAPGNNPIVGNKPLMYHGAPCVHFNGCLLPEHFGEFRQRIKNLKIRDDDIFVCCFPKCGTTWTQEMVWCIANDFDYEKARKIQLVDRFPFLEYSGMFDYKKLLKHIPQAEVPDHILDSVDYVDKFQGRRFIKTHLPFQLLPHELQTSKTNAKMIYVARDPRDCMISVYHHRKLRGVIESLDDALKNFMEGRVISAPFWDHVLTYWNRRETNKILFITYEELSANVAEVMERVAEFLGKTLHSSQVDTLREHLDINNFRKNKAVNHETIIDLKRKYGLESAEGSFIRRGKSRGFVDDLSEKQIDEFTKWSNNILQGTDYPLLT